LKRGAKTIIKRLLFLGLGLSILFTGACTMGSDSQITKNFSWGQYVSAGQDQKTMGPCSAFIGVALVETMVRMYFNQPGYLLDLSEKQPYSVWGEKLNLKPCNNAAHTSIEATLLFAKEVGLVQEIYYPYIIEPDLPPMFPYPYFGNNPNIGELSGRIYVTIPGYQKVAFNSDDELKMQIIANGPLAIYLPDSPKLHESYHAFLLAGWRVNSAGNTEWEFCSDPWPNIGTRHYYKEMGVNEILTLLDRVGNGRYGWAIQPIANGRTITCGGLSAVRYVDNDRDGYYSWGIGPKPAGCPGAAEEDGNDNDPTLGPMDIYGNCRTIHVVESYEVASRGDTVSAQTIKFRSSGTYYWNYFGCGVPNSGYYMNLYYNGTFVRSDERNPIRSGSLTVQAGQTCTIEVRGGQIYQGNFYITFYGNAIIHN
jgi:hypothetical protein